MSGLPQWADGNLSIEMPLLRERGEGQELEFKRDFPAQAHEMSEVIAAFATSGGGRILLGVDDDGNLADMPWNDGSVRDELVRRAQGLVRNVRPDVKANLLFACDQDHVILCIQIIRQDEPVYYYDGRPYIRDDRISRRATPDEVKSLVWKHPSSEQKRRAEELNYMAARQIVEESQRVADLAHETRMGFMRRNHE